jgi:predicted ATPase/predicted negative regulator of RcsB-dependent stress response
MTRLNIRLLGPPQIECENQPIEVDTRKAIALLAYIAVTGKRQRRDSLVNLLWPEYDQNRGRTNLRRTIYALRKCLKGKWLDIDREEIGLDSDADIWLDVNHFYRYLAKCREHGHPVSKGCPDCIASLIAAVELYRGDFMSGFSLRDSINYDEWQFLQAESLRRVYTSALEGLVESHAIQGDFEIAIHYANQWLTIDPLNESAHCRLMQLYASAGQRSAVMRQYEACVKVLRDELDISPQSSTTKVYETIIEDLESQSQAVLDQELPKTMHTSSTAEPPILTIISRTSEVSDREKAIFVARDRELAQLQGHLDSALKGHGHPILVSGGAGQGKTLLLQEFALLAQKRYPDLLFAGGNCNAHTGLGDPYLPFRQILSLLTGDVDSLWAAGAISQNHAQRLWDAFPLVAESLVEVGPDLIETVIPAAPLVRRATAYITGGMSAQLDWLVRLREIVALKTEALHDPSLGQSVLFEQYTRMMIALDRKHPLLLVLDDLQWADIGSISLLFHLGRRLGDRRILIAGAYRPEELSLGRGEERHPLESVINEFRLTYGDITIDLDRAEKRGFVDAYLDTEPNRLGSHFRQTLYHQTKGHPLFTVEFLRGMQERGDLVRDEDGFWMEGQTLDWEILPTRIEAVIAERVGRLDSRSQEALRVASVEGETFTAEVVARVLNEDQRDIIDVLSHQLERKHRLVRAQEIQRLGTRRLSRYRFRHILFQSYLYHSLDPVERAYLHEVVGTTLEGLYQDDVQAITPALARHFLEAGILEKAIAYLFQAGENAKRSSAHEAAITHLTNGLALLEKMPKTPGRDRLELDYCLALGVPLVLTKGHSTIEVEETYTRASELCQQIGEKPQHFQALLGLRRFYLHRGELEKAHQLGEQLIDLAHQMGDPLYISRAYMMHIEILYRLAEFVPIQEHYHQGMAYYNPDQSLSHINLYGNDTGIGCRIFEMLALGHLGYPEKALAGASEMLAIARELSHPFTMVFGLYFAGKLYQLFQDVPAVKACADELLEIAQGRGFSMYIAWGKVLQGWVLVESGEIDAGLQGIQQGLSDWQDMGARLLLPNFMLNLAEAYRRAGQNNTGIAILDEALGIINETGERTFEAELYRIKGDLLSLKEGGADGAQAFYQHALQVAQTQGSRAWELRAAISLYRLQEHGIHRESALQTLKSVYECYREGLDLPDLVKARRALADAGAV